MGRQGFTLLEVLVALAVLALSLMAALKGSGAVVQNAAFLRERTLAHWVAMNRAAELELAPSWIELGTTHGRATMANREWSWTVQADKTPDADIRRASIVVTPREGGDPLATVEIYLDRP